MSQVRENLRFIYDHVVVPLLGVSYWPVATNGPLWFYITEGRPLLWHYSDNEHKQYDHSPQHLHEPETQKQIYCTWNNLLHGLCPTILS